MTDALMPDRLPPRPRRCSAETAGRGRHRGRRSQPGQAVAPWSQAPNDEPPPF